jgi:hypothetical protein
MNVNLTLNLVNTWFVSYGLGEYDPNLFNVIENNKYNIKPKGGLWTSPKNSNYGWIDFCRDENYCKFGGFKTGFEFQLKPDSKIYIIDTFFDLIKVPYKIKDPLYSGISYHQNFIDYENMANEYDAIWLTDNGQFDTRSPEMQGLFDFDGCTINLYGWDCESLIILRKECIINVRNIDKNNLPKL